MKNIIIFFFICFGISLIFISNTFSQENISQENISQENISQGQDNLSNDRFIIHAGLISHYFNDTDDTRKSTGRYEVIDGPDAGDIKKDEIEDASGWEGGFEWYLSKNFGVGYLFQYFVGGFDYHVDKPDYSFSYRYYDLKMERRVIITNHLITVHFVHPLGTTNKFRIGGMAGFGPSRYEVSTTYVRCEGDVEFFINLDCKDENNSKNGYAGIIGAFWGWGAETGIGLRVGLNYLFSSHSDMEYKGKDTEIMASGYQFHLNLRWAFDI